MSVKGDDPKGSLDADVIILYNGEPFGHSKLCTIKAKRTSVEPSQMIPLCAG